MESNRLAPIPRRSPKDVFGVNMPFIDAKNPGNSYLLYKIILGMAPRCNVNEESANPGLTSVSCEPVAGQLVADEFRCADIQCVADAGAMRPDATPVGQARMDPAQPIVPSWVPSVRWRPPVAGEYDRLRTRIRGDGMPPASYVTPTSHQNARAISAWIALGASPTPATCP